MVKRLGINLIRYDDSFDVRKFAAYSIVDSQKSYTPIDLKLQDSGAKFLAFIDHHREDAAAPPALFVDTRQYLWFNCSHTVRIPKRGLP